MMWITPLLVATSAAGTCDVVHRDLVHGNRHYPLGALRASHLRFSRPQVRAQDFKQQGRHGTSPCLPNPRVREAPQQ